MSQLGRRTRKGPSARGPSTRAIFHRLYGLLLWKKYIYLSDSLTDKIFKLTQEKNIQEKNRQTLMSQTSSNSALIGEITSEQINPKTIKFVLQGFMFGMIFSIFLALIIGKFKAYKEEKEIIL